MSEKRGPRRTCIGCRGVFPKDEVVRVIAGPVGAVIDYREKLPGRAAYLCPRPGCITKALQKDGFSRALRTRVAKITPEEFTNSLIAAVRDRIVSLIGMAAKAGRISAGYSAVRDGLEKGFIEMLFFAEDLSDGTREKIGAPALRFGEATLFTKDELGALLGREAVGVAGITDRRFAEACRRELERLNGLRKAGQ